ncbi:hypothetical protein [Alicyclobacillus macrosporangiidus]|uniref:hypothetical protein n=1 Tax=Alicyclobacillus macrosporangiidus TaxID=392015 RepID=UPI000497E555|nr:hypothetical protein [Alicyclobacillus macrosporangiidus]
MKRHITLHWDQFVADVKELPQPSQEYTNLIQAAEEFLRHMIDEDLSAEYILNLTDDTLAVAWEILHHDDYGDPLRDMAQLHLDDSAWNYLLSECLRLPSIPDPSVGEAFI